MFLLWYRKKSELTRHTVEHQLLDEACREAHLDFYEFNPADYSLLSLSSNERPQFWPLRDGQPIPLDEWLLPQDVRNIRTQLAALRTNGGGVFRCMVTSNYNNQENHYQLSAHLQSKAGRERIFGVIQDISNLIDSEKKAGSMQKMLYSFLEDLSCAAYIKEFRNGELRFLYANNELQRFTGHSAAEIVGHNVLNIMAYLPEQAERIYHHDIKLIQTDGSEIADETRIDCQGRHHFVKICKKVIDGDGGAKLLLGFLTDVTELVEARQSALAAQAEQKKLLDMLGNQVTNANIVNHCLKEITAGDSFDTAIEKMLSVIGTSTCADRCYVIRFTPDLTQGNNTHEWLAPGSCSMKKILEKINLLPFNTFVEHWQNGNDLVLPDTETPPEEWSNMVTGFILRKIRSVMVTPIRENGKLLGVIGIDFVRSNRTFSESDIETLHNAANLYLIAREHHSQVQKIEDSVSMQRQIVKNMQIPVALLNLDYQVLMVNPAARQLAARIGQSETEQFCFEYLCHQSKPSEWCPARKVLETHAPASAECTLGKRQMIISALPIFDRDGKLTRILETSQDITEERERNLKLELQSKELRHLNEKLEGALVEAKSAARSKSQFIATMSHEIRTPLNAVIGFSELLQSNDFSKAEETEYLRSINLAGTALLGLINDILDLSKIEAGQTVIQPSDCNIPRLASELQAIFRHRIEEKSLKFELDIPEKFPILRLDVRCLRQILLNLLGNAVKFTDHGSISLRFRFEPDDEKSGLFSAEVTDTGCGITPEYQSKVFEPFVQDDVMRGTRADVGGTGLGLSIARRLSEGMGGSISMRSTPGSGSTFIVTLPGTLRGGSVNLSPVPASTNFPAETSRKIRLMLIDDVPMNLRILAAMAGKLECECKTFLSPLEALHTVPEFHPDWILTDLWMPDMDGTELLRELRRHKENDSIRVAAVTADIENANNFDMTGFDGILLKPISLKSLQKLLSNKEEETKC